MAGPAFEEIIRITWDIRDVERSGQEINAILLTVDNNIREIQKTLGEMAGSWSSATASVSRFSTAVMFSRQEVTMLNARLASTIDLASRAAASISAAIGGGAAQVELSARGRDPATGRFVSLRDLPGYGGGSGAGSDWWNDPNLPPDIRAQIQAQLGEGPAAAQLQTFLYGGRGPGGRFMPFPGYANLEQAEVGIMARGASGRFAGLSQFSQEERDDAIRRRRDQIQETRLGQIFAGGSLAADDAERQSRAAAATWADRIPGLPPIARVIAYRDEMSRVSSQIRDLLKEQRLGDTSPHIAQNIQNLSERYNQLGQELRRAERSVDALSNVWVRHMYWISQTILIMGALRVAVGGAREVIQDVTALSDTVARLGFLEGVTPSEARLSTLTATTRAAQYGVRPREAMDVQVLAARLDSTPEMIEQARELYLVYNQAGDSTASFDNVLRELQQTQMRANATGLEHINVMDTIATIYRDTGLNIEQTFDAIQAGIALHQSLGVSAETAALAIAEASQATETTAEVTAGRLARLVQLFREPARLAELKQWGVTAETAPEGIRQIASVARQIIATGDEEAISRFFSLISGGTLQARRDIQDMATVLAAFDKAIQESRVEVGAWERLFDKVGQTIGVALKELTASAENFVNVWANTGNVEKFFNELSSRIQGLSGQFHMASMQRLGRDAFADLSPEEQLRAVEEFNRISGGRFGEIQAFRTTGFGNVPLESLSELRPGESLRFEGIPSNALIEEIGKALADTSAWAGFIDTIFLGNISRQEAARMLETAFMQWVVEQFAAARGVSPQHRPRPPSDFGVTATIPQPLTPLGPIYRDLNVTESQFMDEYQRQLGILTAIPGYREQYPSGVLPTEIVTVLDETGKVVVQFEGHTAAAAQAVRALEQEARNAARTFAGFRQLPEGVSVEQLQVAVGRWESRIAGAEPGAQDYEKAQVTMFWDEGTRTFRPVVASQDALRFAIEELTDVQKQITGIFNVPVGGEVQVAFAALQAGFVPSNRLSGGGPGSDGAALSLAASSHQTAANRHLQAANALIAAAGRLAVWTGPYEQGDERAQFERAMSVDRDVLRRANPRTFAGVIEQGDERRLYDRQPVSAARTIINVTNRNMIYLDGRLIATQVNRYNHSELAQLRRSTGAAVSL